MKFFYDVSGSYEVEESDISAIAQRNWRRNDEPSAHIVKIGFAFRIYVKDRGDEGYDVQYWVRNTQSHTFCYTALS